MLHENQFFPRMGGGGDYSGTGSGGGVKISEPPSPPVFPGSSAMPMELKGVAPLIEVPHVRVYQAGREFYLELSDLLYRQKNNVHFHVKEPRWVKLESGMLPIEAWLPGEFLDRSIRIRFDFNRTGAYHITRTDRQLIPIDRAPETPSAEHWREIQIYPRSGKVDLKLRRTQRKRELGRKISGVAALTVLISFVVLLVSAASLHPTWFVVSLVTLVVSFWATVRGDRAWHDTEL